MRPLFWVKGITTTKRFAPALGAVSTSGGPARSADLGALPCECVREMLQLTSRYRSRWAQLPSSVICADAPSLDVLLETGAEAFAWRVLVILFNQGAQTYKFTADAAVSQQDAAHAFGGRLLPASACVAGCHQLGWCVSTAAPRASNSVGSSVASSALSVLSTLRGAPPAGRCRCFPEAVATPAGSCARVEYAEAPAADRASADAWAPPRLGVRHVGRALGGLGHVPLVAPSSAAVSFNYMPCPANCSSRGRCDLHGFCACDAGYWGLDCGLTRGADGAPVAWHAARPAHAAGVAARAPPAALAALAAAPAYARPAPRVYVYDLDVAWRVGPQLLGEHDFALTERLLASPHREADPLRADYFWLPGPNLRPREKLAYVRARWPHWNRTRAGAARHVLTLMSERGVGDTDLAPPIPEGAGLSRRLPNYAGGAARPPAPDLDAESPTRAWLALTLNGMADFRDAMRARAPRAGVRDRRPACHVCFRPGVDVVVPPPAASIDVPTCDELRAFSAEAGRAPARRERAPAPAAGTGGGGGAGAGAGARDVLFFWAGRVPPGAHRLNPMYEHEANVREQLLAHQNEPGFVIVNSLRAPTHTPGGRRLLAPHNATGGGAAGAAGGAPASVDVIAWMRRATFCWAPPGQRYGDARRHLLAAFLGCVPVLSVPDGHHTLEEVVPWREMALIVPPERLGELPAILRAVPPERLRAMRRALHCHRRMLWYASIYGACGLARGGTREDAFDALMRVLAARLPAAAHATAATRQSDECASD